LEGSYYKSSEGVTMHGPIALTFGVLLLVLWSTAAPAQAPASIGAVDALVGDCLVVRSGGFGASALGVGAELYEGDRVRTAAGARLKLRFVDGTVMQLGASTDLVLDRFQYAPDANTQNVLLRVSSGIFRVILELVLPRSAFEVQTATAVATVRGTDWITGASPEATAIVALAGRVAVRNIEPLPGEVVLGPGEGTTVNESEPPTAVTVWGDTRRNQFIERTRVP
jgi:ferric-dicitrate binding protein FerR (iron transport regulator)